MTSYLNPDAPARWRRFADFNCGPAVTGTAGTVAALVAAATSVADGASIGLTAVRTVNAFAVVWLAAWILLYPPVAMIIDVAAAKRGYLRYTAHHDLERSHRGALDALDVLDAPPSWTADTRAAIDRIAFDAAAVAPHGHGDDGASGPGYTAYLATLDAFRDAAVADAAAARRAALDVHAVDQYAIADLTGRATWLAARRDALASFPQLHP